MEICRLDPSRTDEIIQIADWYLAEWSIPKETSIERFSKQSTDDILFHLLLKKDNQIVATGGLHLQVGLVKVHKEYSKFGPWVSMLFTDSNFRNQDAGSFC